jgi:hypothetical protein
MVSRGMKTIVGLAGPAAARPEGPDRAALMQRIGAQRERTAKASKAVRVRVTIAMTRMTHAHNNLQAMPSRGQPSRLSVMT